MTRESSVISKPRLVLLTVGVWLILCLGYELYRISRFLALPATGDLYAHSWSFQLMAFAVFRFPFWLIALLVIFVIEFVLLRPRVRRV